MTRRQLWDRLWTLLAVAAFAAVCVWFEMHK
jgi:hypothetical protein